MDPEELLKDEAFMDRIRKAESLAQVAEILGSKGIEVTERELKSVLDNQEEELTEENLEGVAGGNAVEFALGYLLGRIVRAFKEYADKERRKRGGGHRF